MLRPECISLEQALTQAAHRGLPRGFGGIPYDGVPRVDLWLQDDSRSRDLPPVLVTRRDPQVIAAYLDLAREVDATGALQQTLLELVAERQFALADDPPISTSFRPIMYQNDPREFISLEKWLKEMGHPYTSRN